MVLVSEPTFPGCHIRVRPIGLFLMEDQGHPDHKVMAVPVREPVWGEVKSIDDLPPHMLNEIEHFFTVYKTLEEKKTAALGWFGIDETLEVIAAARAAYHD